MAWAETALKDQPVLVGRLLTVEKKENILIGGGGKHL